MSKFDKIYDTIDEILDQTELGGEAILNTLGLKRNNYPTDEQLHALKNYMETFISEKDRGYLRTVLMVTKPYRTDPIITNVYYILYQELRKEKI
jgi:hypothetical protein